MKEHIWATETNYPTFGSKSVFASLMDRFVSYEYVFMLTIYAAVCFMGCHGQQGHVSACQMVSLDSGLFIPLEKCV